MEPRFCPNPQCVHHFADRSPSPPQRFFVNAGFYHTKVVGPVQRFKCSACGTGFSSRTLSIDYYTKKSLDNREILRAVSSGECVSSIARHLSCSDDSVRNRLDRLGRNAIFLHGSLIADLRLSEHLTADGFESFDRSQFFPNNINLLVGVESQFMYGATHTSIRRKGAMTESQRTRRERLERVYRAPRTGIKRSFARLLAQVPVLWDQSVLPILELRTDEHRAYPRAIRSVDHLARSQDQGRFVHRSYTSKISRTVTNPLFPVNYYDRELRKDVAAYRRESTCFTRNVSSGMLRFCCHMAAHNYQKDYRVKGREWKGKTHAEMAGIEGKRIEEGVGKLYNERGFLSRVKLSQEWVAIWMKRHPTPLKKGAEWVPRFAAVGHLQGSGN